MSNVTYIISNILKRKLENSFKSYNSPRRLPDGRTKDFKFKISYGDVKYLEESVDDIDKSGIDGLQYVNLTEENLNEYFKNNISARMKAAGIAADDADFLLSKIDSLCENLAWKNSSDFSGSIKKQVIDIIEYSLHPLLDKISSLNFSEPGPSKEFASSAKDVSAGKALADERENRRLSRLPDANEITKFSDRPDRKMDAISFLFEFWGDYLEEGILYRDDIERLGDNTLMPALRNRHSYLRRAGLLEPEQVDFDSIIPPAKRRVLDYLQECDPMSPEADYYRAILLTREAAAAIRGHKPSHP